MVIIVIVGSRIMRYKMEGKIMIRTIGMTIRVIMYEREG